MTDTEIVQRDLLPLTGIMEMDETQYARMKGIATMFAQAGIFKDVNAAPVAFAKMVIGRELGLGIPQSMTGIHLIPGGGIQMHYSTILQLVRENGYDYQIVDVENPDEKCVIKWFRGPAKDGDEIGETTFTMEMAKRAEFGKKSGMYEKVPENMLLARAVSNGVKAHVPAVFKGMPVYVPGEIVRVDNLTDGEGDGEPRGTPLPEVVEELMERASGLGHQGWADRATWEYRADRGPEAVSAAMREAAAELDELEAQPPAEVAPEDVEEPPPAVVVPEDPEPEDAEEVDKLEPEGKPEATPSPEEEINVEALRRRLKTVKESRPETEVDKELRDEEIEWIEEKLAIAAEQGSDDNPEQGRLI